MGNSTTTIELNGKRYDARTGQIVNGSATQPVVRHYTKKQEPGQILDGFMRRSHSRTLNTQSHHQAVTSTAPLPVVKTVPPTRSDAKHAKRKIEKSRTLMRPAVKKPTFTQKETTKAPELSKTANASSQRFSRAQSVEKSPHVSRFGSQARSIQKKHAEITLVAPSFSVLSQNESI